MRTVLVLAVLAAAAVAASDASPAAASTQAVQARPTLTVRSSQFGRILFDGRGRALYAFTRDPRRGRSTCYGACAAAWPVYYARDGLRAGAGVRQSLIGTTRRRDGRRQITYAGRPLYYYVGDRRPGQVTCQNVLEFGGRWLVVRPSGRLVR
jgi:predicted lipoprotein with Yx(FWY)xxD motif